MLLVRCLLTRGKPWLAILLGLTPAMLGEAMLAIPRDPFGSAWSWWVWNIGSAMVASVCLVIAARRRRSPNLIAGAAGVAAIGMGMYVIRGIQPAVDFLDRGVQLVFPGQFSGWGELILLRVALVLILISLLFAVAWRLTTRRWMPAWWAMGGGLAAGFVPALSEWDVSDRVLVHGVICTVVPCWFIGLSWWACARGEIAGVCSNCGYSMAGLASRICPECGATRDMSVEVGLLATLPPSPR